MNLVTVFDDARDKNNREIAPFDILIQEALYFIFHLDYFLQFIFILLYLYLSYSIFYKHFY